MSFYLYQTDRDTVLVTLAAAVVKVLDRDPLWIMLVQPSSTGKTETLRLVEPVAEGRLSDLTLAGLLSNRGSGGILQNLPPDSLLIIRDFSGMLGDNSQSGESKADVFNALRDIYDGQYQRDINPTPVSWTGRLSIIAACTPAIDHFSAYANALGTRFVYFRGRAASIARTRCAHCNWFEDGTLKAGHRALLSHRATGCGDWYAAPKTAPPRAREALSAA